MFVSMLKDKGRSVCVRGAWDHGRQDSCVCLLALVQSFVLVIQVFLNPIPPLLLPSYYVIHQSVHSF